MGWGQGDKWQGQGYLAQAAYTALPLGACPKGTSHNNQLESSNRSRLLAEEGRNCRLHQNVMFH